MFHIRQQCEAEANVPACLAKGGAPRREALELEMSTAKDDSDGRRLSARLGRAWEAKVQAHQLVADVATLTGWLGAQRTVAGRAAPRRTSRPVRLHRHATASARGVRCPPHSPLRVALQRQRDDVRTALDDTQRSSSMVENLNSRLRCLCLQRHYLGDTYLSLLTFFLNLRAFMRSRRVERVG